VAPQAGAHLDDIFRLYCQLVGRSDLVFERANRDFFLAVERRLGARCFYVLGFRKADDRRRLVTCELVFIDGTTMHPFYSGIDFQLKGESDLYFNAFYALIDEAERRGVRRLQLAQTAYEVKAELGAVPAARFIAVHHPNPLLRLGLHAFRRWLLPPVKFPQRDVFAVAPPPPKSGRRVGANSPSAGRPVQ
jgi:hypothetical protein